MDPDLIASIPAWIDSLLWGFLALCVLSYFLTAYLFEVLAQKLGEPRWMAWVPIANLYLGLRLIGWGSLFGWLVAGYVVSFAGVWLPGPLAMVAMLVMVPTVLIVLVLSLVYWPLLARRRDLPIAVGLLLVLPPFGVALLQLVVPPTVHVALSLASSAIGLAAFLWIVFYDGGPEAAPHPVGWALTGVAVVVAIGVGVKLPGWLEESGAVAQMQVALAKAQQASPDDATNEDLAALLAIFEGGDAPQAVLASAPADGPASRVDVAEPDPHPVADACPPGHREAGARPPEGREWWCEMSTDRGFVRDGPARRWMHARAVEEEGQYRNGERHGTWTRFWRTGGRHTQAEFRDGDQHGWMHRWDEAGRLEGRTWFQDGEPAPLAAR